MVREEKLHPFKTIQYLLLGILLCILVGTFGFFGGRYLANHPAEPEISAVVLQRPDLRNCHPVYDQAIHPDV